MVTTGVNGGVIVFQIFNTLILLATLAFCVLGIILTVLGIKALRIYIRKNQINEFGGAGSEKKE